MSKEERELELNLDASNWVMMQQVISKSLLSPDFIDELVELNRQDNSKRSKKIVVWLTKQPGHNIIERAYKFDNDVYL